MINITKTIPLIALLFLGITWSVLSQTYTVVKPGGKITLRSSGRVLRTGDTFEAGRLRFSTAKDFLIVVDEKAAAFLLYPADTTLKKHHVKPLPPVGLKPGNILTDLQLRKYLEENDSLLLLDGTFSLELGKEEFPMNEDHFFYIEYVWKGETIRKKLDFRGDTLLIVEKELYTVDENPIDPAEVSEKHFLWYRYAKEKESVAYPELQRPVYIIRPNQVELEEEVKVLLQANEGQPMNVRSLAVRDYLSKFYGMPGNWELDQLIKKLDR